MSDGASIREAAEADHELITGLLTATGLPARELESERARLFVALAESWEFVHQRCDEALVLRRLLAQS